MSCFSPAVKSPLLPCTAGPRPGLQTASSLQTRPLAKGIVPAAQPLLSDSTPSFVKHFAVESISSRDGCLQQHLTGGQGRRADFQVKGCSHSCQHSPDSQPRLFLTLLQCVNPLVSVGKS